MTVPLKWSAIVFLLLVGTMGIFVITGITWLFR